jgi:fermentation-respiration switch protein FrsA (DUF1100 family)
MMRNLLIFAAIAILILYLYSQLVRRTSMFFPARYPEGTWSVSGLVVQPEEVEFSTTDHVRLHGWLFRAGDPMLVWCHGNAGNITERAPMAAEFARRGISVLLFDWRGYGKSEGSPSESGLFRDALAAYDFARSRTTGEIAMYGESIGGPYAAYVAKHRRVRCVVIENSMPSLAAIGNALYRPLPLGLFAPFALTTTRWLNQTGVPVLVIHGKHDQVIPFALGKQLYDGLRVPKEMLVSEMAGHCEMATCEPARYYNTVVRFLTRTSS